ncbi:RCC1/BLIP-II [Neoconidiobolus thromboides FSU 785]|nr:RCC1/BLIP-II [Neoconidiobolus thromboides FSU 785]
MRGIKTLTLNGIKGKYSGVPAIHRNQYTSLKYSFNSKSNPKFNSNNNSFRYTAPLLLITLLGVGLVYNNNNKIQLETSNEITVNEEKRINLLTLTEEEGYKLQNQQVENSRQYPGVFIWGSNEYGLVDPLEAKEKVNKFAKKLDCFENMLFRDVSLDKTHAAAIDSNGDLYQWGYGYFGGEVKKLPEISLKGKDLIKVDTTEDKVITLTKSGELLVLEALKEKQTQDNNNNNSWSSYFTTQNKIAFKKIKISDLAWGEKIIDFSSGKHHVLFYTNKNRLFSMACDNKGNSYGQLGTDNEDNNNNSINNEYKINSIQLSNETNVIDKVVCGDYHNIIKTKDNRIYSFGSNSYGQLSIGGLKATNKLSSLPLEITNIIAPSNYTYKNNVIDIYAGGDTSIFIVNQKMINNNNNNNNSNENSNNNNETIAMYTTGFGQWGQLGNGKFIQASGTPCKVIALSDKVEYSEKFNKLQPMTFLNISLSSTHGFAVYNNETGTEFGNSVYTWGKNQDYQCNTSKKNSIATPIPPIIPFYNTNDIMKLNETNLALLVKTKMLLAPSKKVIVNNKNNGFKQFIFYQQIEAGEATSILYSKVKI